MPGAQVYTRARLGVEDRNKTSWDLKLSLISLTMAAFYYYTFGLSKCSSCPDFATTLWGTRVTPPSQPLFSLFTYRGFCQNTTQRQYYSLVSMCLQLLWVCQKRQTREQMVTVTDLFQSSLCQQSWRVTLWSRWLGVSPSLSPGVCPRSGEKKGNAQTSIQWLFHEMAKNG